MSWDNEILLRDVTNAGLVVSDRINRDAATQIDLEEALEASRYTSHPYSTHPREVISELICFMELSAWVFQLIFCAVFSVLRKESSDCFGKRVFLQPVCIA